MAVVHQTLSPVSTSNPSDTAVRLKDSDCDSLDKYFDILEETLEENDLLDKPCQIFNVDETGLALCPPSLKVVTVKGHRNIAQACSGVKTHITIVGCISAGGQTLPPMVIWNRKTLSPELIIQEMPGTINGLSNNGWIDQHLFRLWFEKHLKKYSPPTRPLLLLMDGHPRITVPTP